jgi:hypothetical protein
MENKHTNMGEERLVNQLFSKMIDLQNRIGRWGMTNSQSNPGAVMELRAWKKELQEIQKRLGIV